MLTMQSITCQGHPVFAHCSLRRSACLPRRSNRTFSANIQSRTRTLTLRSRRGLLITCLKNYSGHDKVSTPKVNENGIVVCMRSYLLVRVKLYQRRVTYASDALQDGRHRRNTFQENSVCKPGRDCCQSVPCWDRARPQDGEDSIYSSAAYEVICSAC